MIPSLTNWADVATILGGVLAVGGIVYRGMRTLRTNDLLHLDLKLDLVHDIVKRTEDKVDRHLEWHSQN